MPVSMQTPLLKVVSPHLTLQGVPKVGFYLGGQRCPENVPFPSCLRACLDFFGEGMGYSLISAHDTTWRLDHTYTCLMGVSGCAFRLSWKPGWYGDNVEIMYMSDDPAAPFVRAFEAAGYALEIVDSEGARNDKDLYQQAIIRSLGEKGRPVIAFGVIGPPEACIITGYDPDTGAVTGWNFFQDFPEFNAGVTFEPSGEFRKIDWFASTQGLLVFGEKQPRPLAWGDINRRALIWALEVMRTPRTIGDRCNGIAAFQAWADHLLRDEDFPADINVLREHFLVHDDAVGVVAEGRWYAARFMELIADREPAMEEDLLAAASCFDAEHDLMWRIWELAGGNGRSDEHVLRLADPTVRRAIIPLILAARDQDAQAAEYIEQALRR